MTFHQLILKNARINQQVSILMRTGAAGGFRGAGRRAAAAAGTAAGGRAPGLGGAVADDFLGRGAAGGGRAAGRVAHRRAGLPAGLFAPSVLNVNVVEAVGAVLARGLHARVAAGTGRRVRQVVVLVR
jgi:hypothetical protein